MAYPDPYPRPGHRIPFIRRWLVITACVAALMLFWQFCPPSKPGSARAKPLSAPSRRVAIWPLTNRPPSNCSKITRPVVCITTAQLVRDVWTRNVLRAAWHRQGFIWDDAGHVVTNFHVIQGASEATVKSSPMAATTRLRWWASPAHDIAVLKIGVGFQRPPAVPVGTSAEPQRWGQRCSPSANPSAWIDTHHRHRLGA